MRLRQLSRKLEVKTDRILEFLAKTGHPMENDANGKLTEAQVILLMEEFPSPLLEFEEKVIEEIVAPAKEIEAINEEDLIEESPAELVEPIELEVPMAPPADVTSQISEEVEAPVHEEPEAPAPVVRLFKALDEPKEDPNIEVIKAATVKLEGLKVLGKIDLPEPKPKAEEEKEVKETVKEDAPRRKVRPAQRNRNSVRGQHENTIEKERQRQEKISARRKRDAEQKLKDKKAENYRRQIKSKPVPSKPKKKKKVIESPVEISSAPILGQNKPKAKTTVHKPKQNKIRKFWGWLNGESDKF